MPDPIPPAMTRDEWAVHRRNPTLASDVIGENDGECAEIVALNNDALHDDSPYKITRQDVIALSVLFHEGDLARVLSDAQHPRNTAIDRILQLREKLAALLPPE